MSSGSLGVFVLVLAIGCGSSQPVTTVSEGTDAGPDAAPFDGSGAEATEARADGAEARADGGEPLILLDKVRIGSRNGHDWPNVGRASAPVTFAGPYAKATLVVDLDTTCYPFEKWSADPPPAGQNWPADCDAFDRNFNVLLDDGSDAGGPPPFEVVHAITPFGGPEHLEVDVTDLANGWPGAHRLSADINAYSDPAGAVTGSNNGWTVSARLDATRGSAPRNVIAVVPLFAGVQNTGAPDPMVSFEVPAGATAARIEYRTSGHGQGDVGIGCIGPAEEFCNHPHQVFVDGAAVKMVRTWRTDCDTLCTVVHGPRFDYCRENPCGAMESVVAPRANWCPGSMTPPFVWEDIPALTAAGSHTFGFSIMPLLPGGNWQVSATYFAFGP